jgi:hypothetical protein
MKQSNTKYIEREIPSGAVVNPSKRSGPDPRSDEFADELIWIDEDNEIERPWDFTASIEADIPLASRPGPKMTNPSRFAKFEKKLLTGDSFLLGDSSKLNSKNEKFRQAVVNRLRIDRQSLVAYLKRRGWKVATRRTEDGNVRFWVS